MVKPSMTIRFVSTLLVAAFVCSQSYAEIPNLPNDNLAPSLISDTDIDPSRSGHVRNKIAGKFEPGAIGNGAPLVALAEDAELPPRLILSTPDETENVRRKVRNAIERALSLAAKNLKNLSEKNQERAQETITNLLMLELEMSKKLYLFNADVRGPEDYLLGFNMLFQHDFTVGLSVELINILNDISSVRLAQYIFHECVPEKGIILVRDDHRAVYNEIQSGIFGELEVEALKKNLRDFINIRSRNIRAAAKGGIGFAEMERLESETGTSYWEKASGFTEFRNRVSALPENIRGQLRRRSFALLEEFAHSLTHRAVLNVLEKNGVVVPARLEFDEIARGTDRSPDSNYSPLLRFIWHVLADTEDAHSRETRGAYLRNRNLKAAAKAGIGDTERNILEAETGTVDTHHVNGFTKFKENVLALPVSVLAQIEKEISSPMHEFFPSLARHAALEILEKNGVIVPIELGSFGTVRWQDGDDLICYCPLVKFLECILPDEENIRSRNAKIALRSGLSDAEKEALESEAGVVDAHHFSGFDKFKDRIYGLPENVLDQLSRKTTFSMHGLFISTARRAVIKILEKNGVIIPLELGSARTVPNKPDEETLAYSPLVKFMQFVLPGAASFARALREPVSDPIQTSNFPISDTNISGEIPLRARVFKDILLRILTERPDEIFFLGVENNIGQAQESQSPAIAPIYNAVREIKNMKDPSGKPLFPNLMIRIAAPDDMTDMVTRLNKDGNAEAKKLDLNNTLIVARKSSVAGKEYVRIEGEGKAWISAIDDSSPGVYIPVFEAITLSMMACLSADTFSIKKLYDAVSNNPIDPAALKYMLSKRILYILPKSIKFDTRQLRDLYELARQAYTSA